METKIIITSIDTEEKVIEIIKEVEKAKNKFTQDEIKDYEFIDNERTIYFSCIFWNKENTKKLIIKIFWMKTTQKLIQCIVSSKKYVLINTIDYNSVVSCIKDL